MTNYWASVSGPEQTKQRSAEITVAISTRNRPDSVKACLRSILEGTVLPAEVIIIDQSGGARTRTLTKSFGSSTIQIHWIRHGGSGLGASQNIAFAHARCPVVAVIDDDCTATPSWIETIARAFSDPGTPDVLTGRVLASGPEYQGSILFRQDRVPCAGTLVVHPCRGI